MTVERWEGRNNLRFYIQQNFIFKNEAEIKTFSAKQKTETFFASLSTQ